MYNTKFQMEEDFNVDLDPKELTVKQNSVLGNLWRNPIVVYLENSQSFNF